MSATTTDQKTHKPWCTDHDGFDDGSADWCTHLVEAGAVEVELVADGGPPSQPHIEITGGDLLTNWSLSIEEARRVHEALGQVLAKVADGEVR